MHGRSLARLSPCSLVCFLNIRDNFEWQFGYSKRFGMVFVAFDTLERIPKLSGLWYRDTIRENGKNIEKNENMTTNNTPRRKLAASPRRRLAETVLIGYGSECDAVRRAVHDGCNVVVWSFVDVRSSTEPISLHAEVIRRKRFLQMNEAHVITKLDLSAIQDLIVELDSSGYGDVVHLVSVGGWNGPHLDPKLSATDWYSVWKREMGNIFHGIDWDLEGNDAVESASNFFTVDCLDKMGAISRRAKEDGYIVSTAPPQSYLDILGASRFSRYVNLTDPQRQWHADFQYFGSNVYAYLLAKHGESIDIISIQLYESYSRAAQAVFSKGIQPDIYLEQYVRKLAANDFRFLVDFSDDVAVGLGVVNVTVPLSKLVLGLANGWADTDDEKQIFISPQQVRGAWFALKQRDLLPRGFMFWTIDEEGRNGVHLARGLNTVLHIRP